MVLYGLRHRKYYKYLIKRDPQVYEEIKLPVEEQDKLVKALDKLYPVKQVALLLSGNEKERDQYMFDIIKVARICATDYFKPTKAEMTKKRRDFVNANETNANIMNF